MLNTSFLYHHANANFALCMADVYMWQISSTGLPGHLCSVISPTLNGSDALHAVLQTQLR